MGHPITNIPEYKVGAFALPLNSLTLKNFNSDIITYEEIYLCDLLGFELYDLFVNDLDETTNLPQEDRFVTIFNKLYLDSDYCKGQMKSRGINEMLKGFVCFEYLRSIEFQSTMVGTKINDSENSLESGLHTSNAINLYNKSITSYHTIQRYIIDNEDIYPEFKGVEKDYLSII